MATFTSELRYTECPTCDTRVEEQTLARLGLTREELTILKNHRKDESFGKFLQLVDLTMKRMDPEKLATESEMKRIMTQLQKTIESVDAKVGGTSIGKLGRDKFAILDFGNIFLITSLIIKFELCSIPFEQFINIISLFQNFLNLVIIFLINWDGTQIKINLHNLRSSKLFVAVTLFGILTLCKNVLLILYVLFWYWIIESEKIVIRSFFNFGWFVFLLKNKILSFFLFIIVL